MRKVPLILVATAFTLNVFSQEYKNRINLSFGPSFAIGLFGDKSIDNEDAGYAGTGADIYLFYEHKFSKNYGIGIKWFGNSNKYDTDRYIENLNYITGDHWTAEEAFWGTGGLFAGATANVPTSDKLIVNFKLLVGYAVSTSPLLKVTDLDRTDTWLQMESVTEGSIGFDFGAGIIYLFKPKWSVDINFDFIGSKFEYGNIVINNSGGSHDHTSYLKQSVEIINTTVGINYHF